jgi:ParE toxin of type II toxin-antitoxin system, parDE
MKFTSVIQNTAKNDLREAVKWYNIQKKGLGNEFLSTVKQTISRLRLYPNQAHIRYFEVHTAVMQTFPYMIHYIDSNKKAIIVIGILHTSKNPDDWKNR